MEYWDVYDKNLNKMNKIVKRKDKLNNDEFHIVVNAWIKNDNEEFLISKRVMNKSHGGKWETTGGSILSGEGALEGVIREVKEELGVDLNKKDAILIGKTRRYFKNCPDILFVYLFNYNIDINNVIKQEEEVDDVMWASKEEILELIDRDMFEYNAFFYDVLNFE